MAIKLTKTAGAIPEALETLADRGLQNSILAKHFDEIAGSTRKLVMAYLAHNEDGFDLTEKTIKTKNGALTFVERSSFSFDADAIEALITSGAVTLSTILQCVSFKAENLKTALGSKFNDVATKTESQTLAFKPNADYRDDVLLKAEVITQLGGEKIVTDSKKSRSPAGTKNAIETNTNIEDSIRRAETVAATSTTKPEAFKVKKSAKPKPSAKNSVEAELDDMLGGDK